MIIDHIYIFSDKGQETDKLVKFGLTEGSGRKHQGIGTANRRVFFENFYLEILWVQNPKEAQSVNSLGIWERSNYQTNSYSRFGICLKNTEDTDSIFTGSMKWQPDFLPQGSVVDLITNEKMPWIFRLPRYPKRLNITEPIYHKIEIGQLTKAVFHLKSLDFEEILSKIEKHSILEFHQSLEECLILDFDNRQQGKTQKFPELSLIINY